MTDVQAPPVPHRPQWIDNLVYVVGELHRPFAIIVSFMSIGFAIVWMVITKADLNSGAIFAGAIGTFGGALYGVKSLENASVKKHETQAQVAVAQAGSPAP